MQGYSIEEWNYLTLDERVEAVYKHYYKVLNDLRNTKEEINMDDYTCVSTLLAVLANIRGSHASPF